MSASRRTHRDERRRRLGQNFLRPDVADHFVDGADIRAGELVLEIGAGNGAIAVALARRGADVVALEADPVWAERLRQRVRGLRRGRVQVVAGDFFDAPLPATPFRVVGSLPFGRTTDILRRLFDRPRAALLRADMIVQYEVARRRAAVPPATLLSTTWAPWWEFRLNGRIPASAFRPVPRVDGGVLVVTPRQPPLLPDVMAEPWADFVRAHWPFTTND